MIHCRNAASRDTHSVTGGELSLRLPLPAETGGLTKRERSLGEGKARPRQEMPGGRARRHEEGLAGALEGLLLRRGIAEDLVGRGRRPLRTKTSSAKPLAGRQDLPRQEGASGDREAEEPCLRNRRSGDAAAVHPGRLLWRQRSGQRAPASRDCLAMNAVVRPARKRATASATEHTVGGTGAGLSSIAGARWADREPVVRQLDVVGLPERGHDRVEVGLEQRQQSVIGDVARGDHEQPSWRTCDQVAVSKVLILGYQDSGVVVGQFGDPAVGRTVAVR